MNMEDLSTLRRTCIAFQSNGENVHLHKWLLGDLVTVVVSCEKEEADDEYFGDIISSDGLNHTRTAVTN
jgi:hypothetical protein